ncbi:MAG: citramalate synthase [Chloroflexota bacterium]|nr:citramalate synthase [Chloroflexota bacterium]
MRNLELYDTTLRDGAQREGISFSLADKVKITRRLDELGIDYIEGGWPGSNPKDAEFFERASHLGLRQAKVAAFSMTCRVGMDPADDPNMQQLVSADTEVVTVAGKSWDLHVHEVLHTSLGENLRLITDTCSFLRAHGQRVFYDAEHFFDGFKADPEYALETLRAAVRGGAERIIPCDTNGGSLPSEVAQALDRVRQAIDVPLGIHAHNDGGLAVANTLIGVEHGVVQVQGTINGYGERCGNADLCTVIPDLHLKMGFECLSPEQLARLTELSHYVAEIANLSHNSFQPYVGDSAFTHKGGMHADAMAKCEGSYQHINPALVGNRRRVVVSELSGKANVLAKAQEFGIQLDKDSQQVRDIVIQIKELESQGFQFESAEGSMELLMRQVQPGYQPPFELLDFTVLVENRWGRGLVSEAMVKLRIGDEVVHTAAEGNGPVNALDKAAREALVPIYPELRDAHLTDYKVRILDEKEGTAARVRVLIDSTDDGESWSTVGSSPNIIQASWQALVDSLEYAILKGEWRRS